VADKQIEFDGAAYEVRTYEHRQARYKTIGRSAADAEAARHKTEREFVAVKAASSAGLMIETQKERKTLRRSATEFVADCESRGALEAMGKSRLVTDEFIRGCKKTFLDEVDRADILRFHTALRKRACSERTVFDKHNRLKSWFKFAGIDYKAILPPTPKFDKKLPTVYSKDELSSILSAAPDGKERLTYSLALKCGLREQELMHLEYADVDEQSSVLRVRSKPRFDFKVKDSEERDVPVPDDVLADIRARREANPKGTLTLPTAGGRPNGKLLRTLKRLAKNAGLNCGRCEGCESELQECSEWTLHRFRRTYCTTLLRSGLDVRTVQGLMGHADIETTMRYLSPASADTMQAQINAVQWL